MPVVPGQPGVLCAGADRLGTAAGGAVHGAAEGRTAARYPAGDPPRGTHGGAHGAHRSARGDALREDEPPARLAVRGDDALGGPRSAAGLTPRRSPDAAPVGRRGRVRVRLDHASPRSRTRTFPGLHAAPPRPCPDATGHSRQPGTAPRSASCARRSSAASGRSSTDAGCTGATPTAATGAWSGRPAPAGGCPPPCTPARTADRCSPRADPRCVPSPSAGRRAASPGARQPRRLHQELPHCPLARPAERSAVQPHQRSPNEPARLLAVGWPEPHLPAAVEEPLDLLHRPEPFGLRCHDHPPNDRPKPNRSGSCSVGNPCPLQAHMALDNSKGLRFERRIWYRRRPHRRNMLPMLAPPPAARAKTMRLGRRAMPSEGSGPSPGGVRWRTVPIGRFERSSCLLRPGRRA